MSLNKNNAAYSAYDRFYLNNKDITEDVYIKHCKGFEKKLSSLLSGPKDKKLLDLGCGCGFLVYFLKRKGFKDVTGIDLNEKLISIAKSRVDAQFIVGNGIEHLRKHGLRYDIVFLWNVLEHISKEQIIDSLKVLHASLSDNGFMVIRTPNMTNLMSQGNFCDDFTHRSGFTEQSIEQVARQAGFSHIEMLNQFRMQNLKGKLKSIVNAIVHKSLLWLRGGTKCKVFYRNLYVVLCK